MRRKRAQHRDASGGLLGTAHACECAFTLVEVLLATVLGGAVVTVTTVVAVQSVSVQRVVESELVHRWERMRVLDQFEADVEGELTWLPDSIETTVVPDEPNRLVEIVTLASVSDVETLFQRRLPARVAYVLQESPAESGSKRLWRELQFLTDPGSEVRREAIADGLLEVRVERFDQKGWTTTPAPRNGAARRPRALRLICHWTSDPEQPLARTVITFDKAQGLQSGVK